MKIITSGDLHLDGAKTPSCRTDDFYQAQVVALDFISELLEEYNARHVCAGDILDRAVGKSVSEAVKSIDLLLQHLPQTDSILGNHDVKNRSLEYYKESTIYALISAGRINFIDKPFHIPNSDVVLHGFSYGQEITHLPEEYIGDGNTHIALYHGFVDEKENALIGGLVAEDIVKEFYEDYTFIVTADHHKPFTHSYEGCTLINTGSLLRISASQKEFKPRVWLIDTETKKFEFIYMPIEEGVISREHLDIQKDRDDRIESFVTSMDNEYEISDNFVKNMEKYIAENMENEEGILINKNVEKFIYKSMEGNIE